MSQLTADAVFSYTSSAKRLMQHHSHLAAAGCTCHGYTPLARLTHPGAFAGHPIHTMPMPKPVCITFVDNNWVQYEVYITFLGRGMGMNVTAHIRRSRGSRIRARLRAVPGPGPLPPPGPRPRAARAAMYMYLRKERRDEGRQDPRSVRQH